MAISLQTILDVLAPVCGTTVAVVEHRGDITLTVDSNDLIEAASELRDHPDTQFVHCTDISAVDWFPKRKKDRFEVVYFLTSLVHAQKLRLKVVLQGDEPICPSVTEVWKSANWYERETYDMYGIRFEGHPDLRRFYMPEDYVNPETGEPSYPLRKDFPLMGVENALPLPEKYPNDAL